MGWSGGSEVMNILIDEIRFAVYDDRLRARIYNKMIDVLKDMDWDCPEECLGKDIEYDKTFNYLYPEYLTELEG